MWELIASILETGSRDKVVLFFLFVCFFLGGDCACVRWKFLGQGVNLYHTSNQSRSSDNARSLTFSATKELPKKGFLFLLLKKCFFGFFCLFRTTPTAYGSSQARDRIGAVAAGLHHSSRQCRILDPLCEARDQTCILMDF